MRLSSVVSRWILTVALLCATRATAHMVLVYPGTRGNNLYTNGTVEDTNGLGTGYQNGSWLWPYGMQWMYPCEFLNVVITIFVPPNQNTINVQVQVEACRLQQIERNGRYKEVQYLFNLVGSKATSPLSCTSILGLEQSHQI